MAGYFPDSPRNNTRTDLPLHGSHRVLLQKRKNSGLQVVVGNKFLTVVPNICGSSVWNLPHVTILTPRIWRWVLVFFPHFWTSVLLSFHHNHLSFAGIVVSSTTAKFNPLNPELYPICYLLALLAHHFLHVSRIRVKSLTLRLLMSYIYGTPILDVSRSHTTTQHSR